MSLEKLVSSFGRCVENFSDRELRLIHFFTVFAPATISIRAGVDIPNYLNAGDISKAYWAIATGITFAFSAGYNFGRHYNKE